MVDVLSHIQAAREHLDVPARKPGTLALFGATALAATAAVLLAGVMVLGPGVVIEEPMVEVTAPGG